MHPERLHALLRVAFFLFVMPTLFVLGLGCSCLSRGGFDYAGLGKVVFKGTRDVAGDAGMVTRSHEANILELAATASEAAALRQALPGAFIGIRVPAAATRSQPGQLLPGAELSYSIGQLYEVVELKADSAQTARLNQFFPPPPGAQWTALVISDTHALDPLLAHAIDFELVAGFFRYAIDFGGEDPCAGCEVQLVGCAPGNYPLAGEAFVRTPAQAGAGPTLTCSQPVKTYITLTGGPAPLVAAFGFWGGLATTSTITSSVVQPVLLEHTGTTTLTFDLDAIHSAQGWSYTWANEQQEPITQLQVGPRVQWPPPLPNLRILGTGLPTCTRQTDVLALQATSTLSPALRAMGQAVIQLLPDPNHCPVADVTVSHIQSTNVVSGGGAITYTLTVTNLAAATGGATVQQSFSPATAVRDMTMPAGCTRTGAQVNCQVDGIPPNGARSLAIAIQTRASFTGDLYSDVAADPVGATDPAFLDNYHGPLTVSVQASSHEADGLYLPLVNRQ